MVPRGLRRVSSSVTSKGSMWTISIALSVLVLGLASLVWLVGTETKNDASTASSLDSTRRITVETTKPVSVPAPPRPSTKLRVLSTTNFPMDTSLPRLWPSSPNLQHNVYSPPEQRALLQRYGNECLAKTPLSRIPILVRYDSLPTDHYKSKLFQYCMLYVGYANVYVDAKDTAILQDVESLLLEKPTQPVAIQIPSSERLQLHEALLYIPQSHSIVMQSMMQLLLETSNAQLLQSYSQNLLETSLGSLVQGDRMQHTWRLWTRHCPALHTDDTPFSSTDNEDNMPPSCPMLHGFCCHVMTTTSNTHNEPVLVLRHPLRSPIHSDTLPATLPESSAYISTVTEHVLPVTSSAPTPNFFDILFENDCLPTQKTCHKCLKQNNHCRHCLDACGCYCRALCHIRPPPKQITREFRVTPPLYRRHPTRLIPKIIHQTWYEPVTPEKYPNMSRLMTSWKQSGWEYKFYNDDDAAAFLKENFPPQVREAYDAITPGAFKADLFRYCVLLVEGGVYADMDVLLESNLDHAIGPDVGFMTPMDEPGSNVGARSCLWNGLLAVAPGHPFIAQTIELVVNNIRNRFTSVDYDDMLCPNPQLSVSHSVDTLFTCGPCILGAGINKVLRRHMQTEFEVGDIDIWGSNHGGEKEEEEWRHSQGGNGRVSPPVAMTDRHQPPLWQQDPRHLIPGRSVILQQNKQDMGAHRFTLVVEQSLTIAATDMPDYDDRPPTKEHYSKTHEKVGVYGLKKLYVNQERANEYIRVIVQPADAAAAATAEYDTLSGVM